MKFKAKVAIFAAALVLALVGMNLLVSPSMLQILNAQKLRNYEIVVTANALPVSSVRHAG
jgi:hypothetical protein